MSLKNVVLATAAAAVLGSASLASAALTIDLRVLSGGVESATPKSINGAAIGQSIQLGLFATITGANANASDEGLTNFYGSLVSTLTSGGSAIGDFAVPTLNGVWATGGSATGGRLQDINGQAGLDIGSTSVNNDYLFARAPSVQTGQSFLIATTTWTVTSLPVGGTTELTFVPRTGSTAAVWREDGVVRAPSTAAFQAGAPITVVVPEPAALGMALPALALLARRRRA